MFGSVTKRATRAIVSCVVFVAAGTVVVAASHADDLPPEQVTPPEPPPPRPLHWSVGAGGFYAITGPATNGPSASAELYPGGRFERAGVRAEYRGLDQFSSSLVMLGVTYEGAAARPRLALAVHVGAGVAWPDPTPVIGGGVHSKLWLWGPLAIGYDSTAYLFYDGIDSRLAFAGTFTVRIGR